MFLQMKETCFFNNISKVCKKLQFAKSPEVYMTGKGLTSRLSFVVYNCEFVTYIWYPGPGVVLDCTDS